MEREKALELVRKQLPEKRYRHTLGVLETALRLAEKYGCDPKKAELAAIFHDYAKYRPEEELKQIIIDQKLPEKMLEFHPEIWHGPAGAYLVEKEAGITNQDILNAIRYHTTGRPDMSLLEKIIFISDYIEPGRNFPGVEETRNLAEEDLDLAILQSLQNTLLFLIKKKAAIYPDTIETYNSFLKKTSR